MSEPLYVLQDENDDLFLLWDAYYEACCAMNRARRAVVDALRAPTRSDP